MRKKQSRADVSATRRTMAVSEEDLTKLLKQRLTYCMEIEDLQAVAGVARQDRD
jgi:hypothetical protein